jgi:CheY-like chemotaxis protein
VLSVRQAKPTEPRIRPVNLERLQVLFVDDDVDVLHLVKLILTNAGAEVSTAGSGQQALELLATAKPDVIISDISMPGFDGYQFIEQLRRRSPEDGGLTPAIALTAHTRTKDQAKALAAGFNLHLAKPMRALQLIAAICEVVEKTGRRSEPQP